MLKRSLKAIAAGIGAILAVATALDGIGFIPVSLRAGVSIVLALLTPVATWLAPYVAVAEPTSE